MKSETINKLLAISLLDGRNRDKLLFLKDYFSEFALIKYRIQVECQYLIFLARNTKIIAKLSKIEEKKVRNIYQEFTPNKAVKIKNIEDRINHDVKAVEYYIADTLKKNHLDSLTPFVHFGLTSYDINIPSYGLILSDFKTKILLSFLEKILQIIKSLIIKTKSSVMLGRTHGQPALPTTMGKELAVFYQRLNQEFRILKSIKIEGKLTGAVGNFNALAFVFPEYDWLKLSKQFILGLGLVPNLVTTQILPYDNWIVLFDCIKRINSILLNLSQDIWWYISFEYFVQEKMEKEVGSSTMAHKINPISFENAEGNLQLANSQFEFFARKLGVTRLQRDLSDSTIKRDFGLAFGFTLLAWDSLLNGFKRISPNNRKMAEDLDNHWEILAEAVQTYLRAIGKNQAFELIKKQTRGRNMNKEDYYRMIEVLQISDSDKDKLKITNLSQYKGLTDQIIKIALNQKDGK